MKQKAIVEEQFKSFEKALLGVEANKHLSINEKLAQLIGVQAAMFAFIFHMENADYSRFRGAFDSAFARLHNADGEAA